MIQPMVQPTESKKSTTVEDYLEFVIERCKIKEKEIYYDARFGNVIDPTKLHQYYKNNCSTHYVLPVKNIIHINRYDYTFEVCIMTEENELVNESVKYFDKTKEFSCYKYDPTKIIPAILENDEFVLFFISRNHPFYNENYKPNYSEHRPKKLQFSRMSTLRHHYEEPEIQYEDDNLDILSENGCASCGGSPRSRMVSPTEIEKEEMEMLFNSGISERKPVERPFVRSARSMELFGSTESARSIRIIPRDVNQTDNEDILDEYIARMYIDRMQSDKVIRHLSIQRTIEDIYKASITSDSESLKPIIPKIEPREDNLL
jgi:hypothetical protein